VENIKDELKKVIIDVMLPESEEYLEELNLLIKNDTTNQDDIEAKKDIESFIEELKTILELIKENKLSNEDAKSVYEKIVTMLEEHEED
jgi:hypothetical protein